MPPRIRSFFTRKMPELLRDVLPMHHLMILNPTTYRVFGRLSRGAPSWSALLALHIAACCAVYGQVSATAYRALGQADLRRNGVNGVQGLEVNNPLGIVIDTRGGQKHLYISDTLNSRVLAWADVNSYQIGDFPALILGQPGPQYSIPLGIGAKGLNAPMGLAVDPTNGNLYVADVGDNRVVRFLAPFDNPGRIEPDGVYGQPNFTSRTATSTSNSSMNQPRGIAFDSAGNLWVADTGNHRVLRFGAASLNNAAPVAADTVIGQKDFFGGGANAGGTVSASGFDTPVGLALDAQNNLYVADFRNARVLRFPAPVGSAGANAAANAVWGQSDFVSKRIPQQATGDSIGGPEGIAVDNSDNLFVADVGNNRVLIFPLSASPGATAKAVIGQSDLVTTSANTGTAPFSSPNTLSAPADVKVDGNGNVFVADSGNHRVLVYQAGSKSASRVWGQLDFGSNGANQVKPGSINVPYTIAIDYSRAPFALYVSDASNNRVLVWRDAVRFRSGDAADLVIGQPNMRTAVANVDTPGATAPSRTSLSSPSGMALDPFDGTLYVADAGNNRVLRFPRPVDQGGRITPDAVIGQSDFTSAASAAVSASSLNSPGGLALGPNGNLFVADFGNNRVLEFAARPGNGAAAVRVYGQPNMTTGIRQVQVSPQTLSGPQGLAVDRATNLYVADSGANRVLIFSNTQNAPLSGHVASYVLGQSSFGTSGGSGLKTPVGVAVDGSGSIYVADTGNNRVLIYPSLVFLPIAGGTPNGVVGQPNVSGTTANWDSTDGLATASGLFGPIGLAVDRQDTLYVGDAGNHRVLQFLKPAAVVNSATFQSSVPVAPGGLATLFSNGLATDKATISASTWPRTVLNRQLVINDDTQAPIYYLDAGQVNFQVPSNATVGSNRIAVRAADTEELIAGGSLVVSNASPGLFTVAQSGAGQAAVLNQDNTINSAVNPARAGSIIVLYGTGQGQVSPAVPDGTAVPLGTLSSTVAVPTSDSRTCLNSQPSMCVSFGGTAFGDIKYSGLAPGFIGLWQINVQLPPNVTGNAVAVRVVINGTPSNTVTVAVR
jgi:uncharacterized protein (TIGR03437 family)